MSHGVSYFIKEEDGNVNIKLDEKNTTICQTHYIRIIEDIFFKIGGKKSMFLCGKKEHTESEIHIYTRPLTLYQILNIAYYHVSEGNPITNNFKCHHFIYALILAIVEGKRDKKILLNYNAWPMGIRDLDEALKGDGITAFDQVKNNFKMRYTNLNDENFKARIPFIPPGEEQEEE
uniref:BTB domain-containing protein n=1 Tax=Meloidogyne hapla TaxID=6305 RepID=A0A1I8BNW9_MELHA